MHVYNYNLGFIKYKTWRTQFYELCLVVFKFKPFSPPILHKMKSFRYFSIKWPVREITKMLCWEHQGLHRTLHTDSQLASQGQDQGRAFNMRLPDRSVTEGNLRNKGNLCFRDTFPSVAFFLAIICLSLLGKQTVPCHSERLSACHSWCRQLPGPLTLCAVQKGPLRLLTTDANSKRG